MNRVLSFLTAKNRESIIVSRSLAFSLLLACLGIPMTLYGQRSSAHFERLSVEDGLSQSTVTCILQDRQGFLWFGTANGLNKYDGYSFEVFKTDLNDSNSLSGNHIIALCEDRESNLWIGTSAGLNKFDPDHGTFTRYPIPTLKKRLRKSTTGSPCTEHSRRFLTKVWFTKCSTTKVV